MSVTKYLFLLAAVLAAACSGGSSSGGGDFQLIQFMEAGQDNIARNTVLRFRFSQPVMESQDFSERLRVQNIQSGPNGSNSSKAIGNYVVDGDMVTFIPRLPNLPDRSDAGLREKANYHVFLKAGPDALLSASGKGITEPLELLFDTNEYFEDPIPDQPPRVTALITMDSTNGASTDISRAAADPVELAMMDSSELIAAGKIIEPGAGPDYQVFWDFELTVTEPLDPQTVSTTNIKLWQIRENALETEDSASTGYVGDPVNYSVPLSCSIDQCCDAAGVTTVKIRVTPVSTLVDDARYRLVFRGDILGIDFRQAFIGNNGLTGDTAAEIGGLGYITEFLVYDRPAIDGSRACHYEPLIDNIYPEKGQTTDDIANYNSALYDPPVQPGTAIGSVPAFGDGSDGNYAVTGGGYTYLDTGDTPNDAMGNPFAVRDYDPNDDYPLGSLPTPVDKMWDSNMPTEWNFTNMTISSQAILRVVGVNPARFRVQSQVQIVGTLDISGEDGDAGGMGVADGGEGAAGGFDGGESRPGVTGYVSYTYGTCNNFQNFLNNHSGAKAGYPFTKHGKGPGRGYAGGEFYQYYYYDAKPLSTSRVSGTGGGGGGHATAGHNGADVRNVSGQPGTPGPACDSTYWHYGAGLIGLRSRGGSSYGDREILDVLVGGSGGGAGGNGHTTYTYSSGGVIGYIGSGGGGGGGGGIVEIYCAGDILVSGGMIDARGGDGGEGDLSPPYYYYPNNHQPTGAGGGGSGGPKAGTSTGIACSGCNKGGDGAVGFILLMDGDGTIDGLLPSGEGEYDTSFGALTIAPFKSNRFGAMVASTELFHVGAADPTYQDIQVDDVNAVVALKQSIEIYASSAKASDNDPLAPNSATETTEALVATVEYAGAGILVTPVAGGMANLNPTLDAQRRSFVRLKGYYTYGVDLEAAVGPYAYLDMVTVRYRFND